MCVHEYKYGIGELRRGMGCNWGLTPSKCSVAGVSPRTPPSPPIAFHIFLHLENLVSLGQTMLRRSPLICGQGDFEGLKHGVSHTQAIRPM